MESPAPRVSGERPPGVRGPRRGPRRVIPGQQLLADARARVLSESRRFISQEPTPHPSSLPEGQKAPWEAAVLTGRGKRMRSLRVRTVSTASSSTASSCPGHAGRTGEAKGERGALAAGPRPLVWKPGGSRVSQGRARAATFSAETVATRGPRPFPPVQRPPPAPRPTEGDMREQRPGPQRRASVGKG